jgi:hypothetical protein
MIDEFVKTATASCSRKDCSLTWGSQVTTLISSQLHYNKQGEFVNEGDPNTFYSVLTCSVCGDKWTLSTKQDESTLRKQTQ